MSCEFFLAAAHIPLEERLIKMVRKCRETRAKHSKSRGCNRATTYLDVRLMAST